MTKRNKIAQHERIAQYMMTGKVEEVLDIHDYFAKTDMEKTMYRLPAYIHCIKKDGGVVKTFKNGRDVVAYQLLNPNEFSTEGRYVGKQNQ